MKLKYHLVNVFTRGGRLTGNPLCVFEDGTGLDTESMQALARQFNLSETTFILPSSRATARVRIFTPNFEMPFAGHPTLGTFREDPATGSACANLGGWYLATGAGVPLVRRVHQGERVQRPSELLLSIDPARAVRVGGQVVALGSGELWP
jgi:predicted PhzF superfamily epimerase YddE/YHI9